MIINDTPVQHLTYCLNVHPGESWDANLEALNRYVLDIRQRVSPSKPFGLGLRLSWVAAVELSRPERLSEFKTFLQKHDLYVFTINGFPYGVFHGVAVKEDVYAPDWRTSERVAYTNLLADLLAEILPDGVMGSISSVPGMWLGAGCKVARLQSHEGVEIVASNIARCAEHFHKLEQTTGSRITLALEPEPDCLFDSTESTIEFFNELLAESPSICALGFDWKQYIGVCLDTCHFSVVFDDPTESLRKLLENDIAVPKVQISSALRANTGIAAAEQLEKFAEKVYLHQVRIKCSDGEVVSFSDLTDEALDAVRNESSGEVRVHMHVPLYFEKSDALLSTSNDLSEDLFREIQSAGIPHLEIETYTFNVLPDELANLSIEDSIEREYKVVLEKLLKN